MDFHCTPARLTLVGLFAPLLALAQTAPPNPLDPHASVPPLVYRSAIPAPRTPNPAPLGWKEANDHVGHIGGWRSYAREASAAPAPASSASPARGKP